MALVPQHPRRKFMREAVEYEIRLSYHDRIMRTLPEAMTEPTAQVLSVSAPGPDFEYEEPGASESYNIRSGIAHK